MKKNCRRKMLFPNNISSVIKSKEIMKQVNEKRSHLKLKSSTSKKMKRNNSANCLVKIIFYCFNCYILVP